MKASLLHRRRVLTTAGIFLTLTTPAGLLPASITHADPSTPNERICDTSQQAAPARPVDAADIYARFGVGQPAKPADPNPPVAERMRTAMDAAVAEGFAGDQLVVAIALAGRESHYRPKARHHSPRTGDDTWGLWSINTINESRWQAMRNDLGLTDRSDLFEPRINARAARWLFERNPHQPFYDWGPYRDDAVLHGDAQNWIEPAIELATQEGYLSDDGSPAHPPQDNTQLFNCVLADLVEPNDDPQDQPTGGLLGPDCDGLTPTGTYNGHANGRIPSADLVWSDNSGYLQPNASAAFDEMATAAAAEGHDISGNGYRDWAAQQATYDSGSGAPPGQSNHGLGLAVDIDVLVGSTDMFSHPTFHWLREHGWKWGWCFPRWARPAELGGTGAGGGTAGVLEPWHIEYVPGGDSLPPRSGDGSGPLGVAD